MNIFLLAFLFVYLLINILSLILTLKNFSFVYKSPIEIKKHTGFSCQSSRVVFIVFLIMSPIGFIIVRLHK